MPAFALALSRTLAASLFIVSAHVCADAPAVLAPEHSPCPGSSEAVALGTVQWNGWGRELDNTRYQPEPAIRASDVEKLGLKWAFGYQSGNEFGQPTVVDGRVFVAGSAGRIYALDSKTGCTYWSFDAAAGSRTAIVIGELGQTRRAALPKKLKRTLAHLDVIKAPSAAFFGDDAGWVYAVDAQRGTLLWRTAADSHPLARIVGAPILSGDRLYVAVASTEAKMAASNPSYGCCTFRGSIVAFDIATGRVVWKTYTVLEEPVPTRKSAGGIQEFAPAGAAIVSSPTIDTKRNVLYVGTGPSMTSLEQSLTDSVAAFSLTDGKLRWVKQLTRTGEVAASSFLASPILRTLAAGNQVLLASQKSGVIYALDPDHGGEVLWQTSLAGGSASGGVSWGSAADHRSVYAALSGQLAAIPTTAGSLTAIDMKTGTVRWSTAAPEPACSWGSVNCSHAQSQAVTVMPGVAFSGSMDGHLRAYSTIDGKILWDFDTAKAFVTQNAVPATGGPLDHGGATIVNGIVYVNSGNALLAFSVNGK